eukprot:49738_1
MDNKQLLVTDNKATSNAVTLTLQSDTMYHSSIITAEGCPDPKQFPCIIQWYNDNLESIYSSTKSLQFQPNVQDAQHKIYCQWIPTDEGDDTSTLLPSKLAEIGPLKRNPALVQDAQAILDKGRGEFGIIIPKISSTQKQKLIIEDTKIHIYIDANHYHTPEDEVKSEDEDISIPNNTKTEFDTVMDVTMTRFPLSMEDKEEEEEKHEEEEESIWLQTYEIKPEYQVLLSRNDLLYFHIENGEGSVMVRAYASTTRERDILAFVIQALADAKTKRNHDLELVLEEQNELSDEMVIKSLIQDDRKSFEFVDHDDFNHIRILDVSHLQFTATPPPNHTESSDNRTESSDASTTLSSALTISAIANYYQELELTMNTATVVPQICFKLIENTSRREPDAFVEIVNDIQGGGGEMIAFTLIGYGKQVEDTVALSLLIQQQTKLIMIKVWTGVAWDQSRESGRSPYIYIAMTFVKNVQ